MEPNVVGILTYFHEMVSEGFVFYRCNGTLTPKDLEQAEVRTLDEFQSARLQGLDFKVRVPEGWVVYDFDNHTGELANKISVLLDKFSDEGCYDRTPRGLHLFSRENIMRSRRGDFYFPVGTRSSEYERIRGIFQR